MFYIEIKNSLNPKHIYLVLNWALKNNYEFVMEMDCDFSHNPKEIANFLKKINEGYDLVLGSRYLND